jgi:antitoxin MazE
MKISIIRIGNSRGVRLPKAVLDQCGFGDAADLSVSDGAIVLRPIRKPREGWEHKFPGGHELGPEVEEWLRSGGASSRSPEE